jgi:hypothetical protein
MLGGHREEVSAMGCHVNRLLSLSSRFDSIEITLNAERLVQSSSVLQVKFARIMDFESNF